MASSAQNAPDGGISRSGEFEGPVDLSGVSAASFALWVRWQSEDGVAMSWVRGSDGKYMSLGLEGGRFRLYNDSQSAVYPTTPVAVVGEWYSVVVVTDGTGEGFYINGVSVGTGTVGFEGSGAGTFRLGGGPPGLGMLDGYVVSGGIWNRKLNRAEVKAFHNKGVNLRYAGLPGAGKLLDERLYCLKDGLDPAAVVDEAGEVQERYGFTAFGRSIFLAPDYSARSSSAFDWDVLFHAELADPETGWQNYGFRYYIAELGRWPNRDPIGTRGGMNLYSFVANQPISYPDILGLTTREDIGKREEGGRLIYSTNCGWIDWSHAYKRDDFWNSIKDEKRRSARGDGYVVRHDITQGPRDFRVTGASGEFVVSFGLSLEKKKSVALGIFMQLNDEFEENQAGFLMSLVTDSGNSEEDRPSDLIGFYGTVEGFTSDQIELICGVRTVPESQCLWDKIGGLKKSKSWNPTDYNSELQAAILGKWGFFEEIAPMKWPEELNSVIPAKNGDEWRDADRGDFPTRSDALPAPPTVQFLY